MFGHQIINCALAASLASGLLVSSALADVVRPIPDEYETAGGMSMATSHAGVALDNGVSSVRTNPAMLALRKEYSLTAGYHWPSLGRDFYTVGVMDSTTSSVAAGLTYTGYLDPYANERAESLEGVDSPIIRRGNLGIAQNFGSIAFGIGAHYVEATPHVGTTPPEEEPKDVRGLGLNVGAVMQITNAMRLAISGENLSNDVIKDYAPRMARLGATYEVSRGSTVFVDFRSRDRIGTYEAAPPDPLNRRSPEEREDNMDRPERMAYAGFVMALRNNVQVRAAFGASTTDDRRAAGAGIRILTDALTISYAISKPYLSLEDTHQALQVGMQIPI